MQAWATVQNGMGFQTDKSKELKYIQINNIFIIACLKYINTKLMYFVSSL